MIVKNLGEFVQLIKPGPNINAAISGAAVLTTETPDWITQAAATGVLSLSKQPESSETHLWLENKDSTFLVRPGDFIHQLPDGSLYALSEENHNSLFGEENEPE